MSKRKAKKVTFWLAYKKPIIITVAASVVIYIIVYLAFRWNGILPAGTDLEKSDWLSFLGAYLSFVGTVIVSMIAIFQSRYYSELAEKKDAASRSYTTKKRDAHEADAGHLDKAKANYEELCRLYPDTFSSINCMENSGEKQRPIDSIQEDIRKIVRRLI